MLLLLLFSFLAGLVTILAPCIWPILPIVLSSSVSGGHKKPLGITIGIVLSFTFFTLFLTRLVSFFRLDPNILRLDAAIIIALLGFTLLIPKLSALLETGISRLASIVSTTESQQRSGFGGGLITGITLGIVWSPCAGPILAAVATLAATNKVNGEVFLVTLSYAIGAAIPLFLFSYLGQRFILRSRRVSPFLGRIQQVFGVLMIVMAVLLYTNTVQAFQLALVNKFPVLNGVFNGFESNTIVSNELQKLRNYTPLLQTSDLFNTSSQAPEFSGGTAWLNNPNGSGKDTKSLTLSDLKGKVTLVDFWTYTCINCLRTLPFVTSWYDKYHTAGFTVIGVHTPEFAFERDTTNVLEAIKRYNIHYPVVQDNDYAIWNAYTNQYWPAEYLIDAKGQIRRTHFGEGEYDKMEEAIQALLKENGASPAAGLVSASDTTPHGELSPESYLGSKRMEYLASVGNIGNGVQTFPQINSISTNEFAFAGTWSITDEYAEAVKDANLTYHFYAGNVYLVMRPRTASDEVKVLLDGKPVDEAHSGKDVKNGVVTLDSDRLYELINLHGNTEDHVLTLQFLTPGTEAFAFTFGN